LKYGANVNASGGLLSIPPSGLVEPEAALGLRGVTPLMDACACGHVEIVRLLLSFGADVSLKDANGDTAVECIGRGTMGLSTNTDSSSMTVDLDDKTVEDIKKLLGRDANSWKPYVKPEFVKSVPSEYSMMSSIRDEASISAGGSKDVVYAIFCNFIFGFY
jgi:hypothetical protein